MNLYDNFQNLYGLSLPVINKNNRWGWGDVISALPKVKNYKIICSQLHHLLVRNFYELDTTNLQILDTWQNNWSNFPQINRETSSLGPKNETSAIV